MASPGLATNNDATYPDVGSDSSVKQHQADHDVVHTMLNRYDNAMPPVNNAYVSNGTLLVAIPVEMVSRWNIGTSQYEPLKPSWALFGWLFLSTNAVAAAAPSNANACVSGVTLTTGDIWDAHVDAT